MTSIIKVDQIQKTDGSAFTFGRVLQVKQARKTDTFSTSSQSFVDVTDLSVTLTPSSSSSKFLVTCALTVGSNWWAGAGGFFGVSRNGTNIGGNSSTAIGDYWWIQFGADSGNTTYEQLLWPEEILDEPATTSDVTYKLQLASRYSSYPMYVNRAAVAATRRGSSWITVREIAG